MKRTFLFALAALFLISTVSFASGSSGGGGVPSGAPTPGVDPFKATETMKCTVTHIRENGTIIVQDKKSRKSYELVMSYKTKLVAEDKSKFDGRKKLEAKDLQVGHDLKVVKRQANGEVLKVKVLKEA